MTTKEELLSELNDIKYSISENDFDIKQAMHSLERINSSTIKSSFVDTSIKYNIIKSFIVTFNINNFSDLTVLFISKNENVSIIEYSGNELLLNEFRSLLDTEKEFYRDLSSLRVKDENFRIYFESMENDNGVYTILTLTESVFFKPSKFHMFCDILLEIIRSNDISRGSVFNDLFEETVIGINDYISANNISESEFYLFKFENIYDFFLKMGLEIIIELSDTIKKKLIEVFGDKSRIFRFSLSEYIVISPDFSTQESKYADLNNSNILDFTYKGIILKHRCIKIPYNNNQSVYDIFEKIF